MPGIQRAPTLPPPEPASADDIEKIRNGIDHNFKQVAQLLQAIRKPLPTQTGDGTYVQVDKSEGVLAGIKHLNVSSAVTLADVASLQVSDEPWNDREYLLERIVKTATRFPTNSDDGRFLTSKLIAQLWNDEQHPPLSYLGQQFQYRSADGSGNSFLVPHLGAANSPYARTVRPMAIQDGALPDAGALFDSLMKRQKPTPHQNRLSSMLFYLATIIVHDLFRTSHEDPNISLTSSYLDLSPLYGSNADEQRAMRTGKDGKIKPDCFSEKRILGFPPGVSALMVMFNRFHNHVVENLATINEGHRFDKPTAHPRGPGLPKTWEQYDEDLFQTGRLVTCGYYNTLIIHDYVGTILNINRTNSTWTVDPRFDLDNGVPAGTGNQVSAEFNLIYRWHSAISERDVDWIERKYSNLFDTQDVSDIPMPEFLQKLAVWEASIPDDPVERDIENIHRDKKTGRLDDERLVHIVVSSVDDQANAFGARQVPAILKAVEVLGIEQARKWNLGTLNELRKYFKLTEYTSFAQISSDPEVQEQLKHLYDTPDKVELYPGVVCEDAKAAVVPGSGLMLPYTTSRAILSDAVALVRGDRYNTIDYHPKALTAWGFSEANGDTQTDSGCVSYKMFYVAFPKYFKPNSVYAHFPFTISAETRVILTDLGNVSRYNFDLPQQQPTQFAVTSFSAMQHVMDNKHLFGVTWGSAMEYLMGPPAQDFMLAGDRPVNSESRQMVHQALYEPHDWKSDVRDFYTAKMQALLRSKKYRVGGINTVDMVRDVTNLVHVHFCAEMFCLPLKTDEHPHFIFTEHELYLILTAVFTCVFFDVDPEQSFYIHTVAKAATKQLGMIVEGNVQSIAHTGMLSNIIQFLFYQHQRSPLRDYGVDMIQRLLASGISVHDLVWGHILGTAGGMVPNQGQLFSEMLDYYLHDPLGLTHWPEIVRYARMDGVDDDSEEMLMRYMLEGSRLACGSAVLRQAHHDTTIDEPTGLGSAPLHARKGDNIFVNLAMASRDPQVFPHPDQVKLDRPLDKYIQFGYGPHQCLGLPMAKVSMTTVLREVAKLPGLRPVKGPQGKVKKCPAGPDAPGYYKYMTEGWEGYFPFPCSMKVNWDDDWDQVDMGMYAEMAAAARARSHPTNGAAANGVAANGVAANGVAANGSATPAGKRKAAAASSGSGRKGSKRAKAR